MTEGFPPAVRGMVVGLLGGSFDPAHEGHVHLTREALKRFGLDAVWWLVSPGNPLKARGPAPLAERLARARALMDDPRVTVTGLEGLLGTRRTVDTVAALTALYPRVRFVWLMGSDNLVEFDRWEAWRRILAMVPVGVLARPGSTLKARLSRTALMFAAQRLPEARSRTLGLCQPPAWCFVNMPMVKQSSSAIRRLAAGGLEGTDGAALGSAPKS